MHAFLDENNKALDMTTATRNSSTAKMFRMFLFILAAGGLFSAWAVPNSMAKARTANFHVVQAERAAFWKSYEGATNAPGDADRVKYISTRVQACASAKGEATLETTRSKFIASENKCLTTLRADLADLAKRADKDAYDRMVVLVDWVVDTAS